MLIVRKDGKAFLAPGDLSPDVAASMIAAGDAEEVKTLRLNRDVRSAGPDGTFSFDAGETVRVPQDIGERVAKSLLNPADPLTPFHAFPRVETVKHSAAVKPAVEETHAEPAASH